MKESQGRGLGLFAVRAIPSGTIILQEAPLLRGRYDGHCSFEAGYSGLDAAQKKSFDALHNPCLCGHKLCVESEINKVVRANCFRHFPAEGPISTDWGQLEDALIDTEIDLYLVASRMNHACAPNTARGFTEDHTILFKAIRNIHKGEEITTTYLDCKKVSNRAVRREWLMRSYGFNCSCTACDKRYKLSEPKYHSGLLTAKDMEDLKHLRESVEVLGRLTVPQFEHMAAIIEWSTNLKDSYDTVRTEFYNTKIEPLLAQAVPGKLIWGPDKAAEDFYVVMVIGMTEKVQKNNRFRIPYEVFWKAHTTTVALHFQLVRAKCCRVLYEMLRDDHNLKGDLAEASMSEGDKTSARRRAAKLERQIQDMLYSRDVEL